MQLVYRIQIRRFHHSMALIQPFGGTSKGPWLNCAEHREQDAPNSVAAREGISN